MPPTLKFLNPPAKLAPGARTTLRARIDLTHEASNYNLTLKHAPVGPGQGDAIWPTAAVPLLADCVHEVCFSLVARDNVAQKHQVLASLAQVPRAELAAPAAIEAGFFYDTVSLDVPGTDEGKDAQRVRVAGSVAVGLQRSIVEPQEVQRLSGAIRAGTEDYFARYLDYVDRLFCPERERPDGANLVNCLKRGLPFPGVDPYRLLKVATEAFVLVNCAVKARSDEDVYQRGASLSALVDFDAYLTPVTLANGTTGNLLPYLALIQEKIPEVTITEENCGLPTCDDIDLDAQLSLCRDVIHYKMSCPCFLELIWSYWHEEAMLVQTMNAISMRFQNRRAAGERDPLAHLEIDPLRPLNNLFWGYIQDEQHRLSVIRRAHEYEHHYGMSLHGKAVTDIRPADRRSKFLESFHNLLNRCAQFFRQDDDTTVVADAFPVLNAVKETHYLLAQGAHNQFGDLPSTARQEMLMQMYLLARPEMREFLGGRIMVPYPEAWMDRVDTVKTLQGWTDTSVVHFHDLAVFGEQILLSIRWHNWSQVNDPKQAHAWARYWRSQIQGYMHGYRAVTGIDLTADVTDAQQIGERYLPPSVHLRNRLAAQKRK